MVALVGRGRWLEDGMASSAAFIASIGLLARYVAAATGQLLPALALLSR